MIRCDIQKDIEDNGIIEIKKEIENHRKMIKQATHGLSLKLNYSLKDIFSMFQQGDFIIAYYKANRVFRAQIPNHVEKVELQDKYIITDTPREDFVKYLVDLQKKILDLLTTVFPKIQFIVTTHSPFILNSLENVVVYDLENHILVEDGLANVPYDGIVEGYFKADTISKRRLCYA
ncbi:hypothetical protein [Hungatella hathewayi]